ncbi:MAG: hypothetical protein LQ352_002579 [Teloschistes flavicans]|nr:MAG: hypothetical protein LQ352_002579 [Teloschistes flavicans]
MSLPYHAPVRLFEKIEAWRQEVNRQTEEELHPQSSHGMKLRSSTSHAITGHSLQTQKRRPALAEIPLLNHSVKPRSPALTSAARKPRKAAVKAANLISTSVGRIKAAVNGATIADMSGQNSNWKGKGKAEDFDDEFEPEEQLQTPKHARGRPPNIRYDLSAQEGFQEEVKTPRRKPGRPPGPKHDSQAVTKQDQMRQVQLNDASTQESRASATLSRSESQSRKYSTSRSTSKARSMSEKRSSDIAIDDLQGYDPPVYLKSRTEVIRAGFPVSEHVKRLYNLLERDPAGCTPSDLRQKYEEDMDTPRKSREPPQTKVYSSNPYGVFPPHQMQYLKRYVDHVVETANFSENGPECQWGVVVCQLLHAFSWWPGEESIRPINIQIVPIQPPSLRPQTHEPGRTQLTQPQSSQDASNNTDSENDKDGLNRLVDWAMALQLPMVDQMRIEQAFRNLPYEWRSLNQTLSSFARLSPIWLVLELKKTYQIRDPRVQLGVFSAAGISKRKQLGWDTSFPTPGITVDGYHWQLYIFFATEEDRIIMQGPLAIGSTRTQAESWQLIHNLYLLVGWAKRDYRQWFYEQLSTGFAGLGTIPSYS